MLLGVIWPVKNIFNGRMAYGHFKVIKNEEGRNLNTVVDLYP